MRGRTAHNAMDQGLKKQRDLPDDYFYFYKTPRRSKYRIDSREFTSDS